MIKCIGYLLLIGILIIACGKDDDDITYPRKFSYKRSEIIKEKIFLIGDNESYSEINPYKGYLDSLRTQFYLNYYHFVKDTFQGFIIESFEVLNKDSVRLEISAAGNSNFITISSDIDNIDLMKIDPFFVDAKIYWDQEKQEIRYCHAFALGIVKKVNQEYFNLDQNFCSSKDITIELDKFLFEHEYLKTDTLGIYLIDLVYQ